MDRIPLWVDLREVPTKHRLPFLRAARAAAAERVVLGADDPDLGGAGPPALRPDAKGMLRDGGQPVAKVVRVRNARDQERAASAAPAVVVDAIDWKVIPLENLIAMRCDRPGTLLALARDPAQALLFRDTLEHGVDGVVLAPRRPEDVTEADRLLRQRGPKVTPGAYAARPEGRGTARPSSGHLPGGSTMPASASVRVSPGVASAKDTRANAAPRLALVAARVDAVEDAGPGDRVCVDATGLFAQGEGLLVGSAARSLILVHAETTEHDLVRARPFRVNAGAVHMYVLVPGGTRYLSELGSGATVLCVARDGSSRTATVGRAKVERRPHTLVRWTSAAGGGHAVLQTAETVRLVQPGGALVAVTDLRVGHEVLVHEAPAARHFGMAVDASIEER